MTSFQKYLNRIFLFRWEVVCAGVVLVLVVLAWDTCFPVARKTIKDVVELGRNITFINKADSIAALAAQTRKQADSFDSTIKATKELQQFTEGTLPGAIYGLAAKAGIRASRVEISVSADMQEGRQMPVRFTGAGDYAACGIFIDGIETLEPAARIKELSIKNRGKGNADLFLDFRILSSNK
jgi:hypothetical protein